MRRYLAKTTNRNLRTRARIVPKGKFPDAAGLGGNSSRGSNKMQHHQQGIQFSRAHEFRNVRDVNKKECLIKLGNHLVRADEQHDLPLCPITNTIDIAKNVAEENNLPAEPKDLHDHP